jgi:hypothetical protein
MNSVGSGGDWRRVRASVMSSAHSHEQIDSEEENTRTNTHSSSSRELRERADDQPTQPASMNRASYIGGEWHACCSRTCTYRKEKETDAWSGHSAFASDPFPFGSITIVTSDIMDIGQGWLYRHFPPHCWPLLLHSPWRCCRLFLSAASIDRSLRAIVLYAIYISNPRHTHTHI